MRDPYEPKLDAEMISLLNDITKADIQEVEKDWDELKRKGLAGLGRALSNMVNNKDGEVTVTKDINNTNIISNSFLAGRSHEISLGSQIKLMNYGDLVTKTRNYNMDFDYKGEIIRLEVTKTILTLDGKEAELRDNFDKPTGYYKNELGTTISYYNNGINFRRQGIIKPSMVVFESNLGYGHLTYTDFNEGRVVRIEFKDEELHKIITRDEETFDEFLRLKQRELDELNKSSNVEKDRVGLGRVGVAVAQEYSPEKTLV